MIFQLTDEQEMLQAAVRGALERAAPIDRVRGWLQDADSTAATALAKHQGWAGIGVPEAAGGQGGGLVELTLAIEEHARGAVPGGLFAHAGLALPAALAAAGAQDPLVATLAAGERIALLAIDAGDPLAIPDTRASRAGSGWNLEGAITHVVGVPEADTILVPAHADGALRLFAVPAAVTGVTWSSTADPGRRLAAIVLAGDAATLVGEEPVDLPVLAARAAVLTSADSLGAAQRMLDMTVRYLGEREQFGVLIGSFQALKHAAAEMLVEVEAARSATYFAAWSLEHGEADARLHASVAKFISGDGASRVAEAALSLHGAVGFTWEHDLHFLYKRAKVNLSLFGSPGRHRRAIGDALIASSRQMPAGDASGPIAS